MHPVFTWNSVDRRVIGRGHFDELTELLTTLTNEVMASDQPFEHDPESDYCTCCLA